MSNIESIASNVGPDVRLLWDDELDAATGGVTEGGCIRPQEVLPGFNPDPTWTFLDVFYHPRLPIAPMR
jgi:hypothetical protein